MTLRLDRLNILNPIVDKAQRPTRYLHRLWQTVMEAIEGAVTSVESVNTAQQETLDAIQQALGLANQAQATAVEAQQVADATSGAAQSGSDSNASLSIGGTLTTVATVVLTDVVAGDLTIAGSGPVSVTYISNTPSAAAMEITEDDGGGEVTVYSGACFVSVIDILGSNYYVYGPPASVATFSSARTTTGTVTYRLKLSMTGASASGVTAALSVRRSGSGTVSTALVPADIGVSVQGYDGDLSAIAALATASGVLRKTGPNAWALDTTTSHLSEGSNLYYTDARARAALSAGGSLSYNSATGQFSYTQPTNVSTFTNDAGYTTAAAVAAGYSPLGHTHSNYWVLRHVAPAPSAGTYGVNSLTYVVPQGGLGFNIDLDLFPFTQYRIFVRGLSSEAGQTVTAQLATYSTPTTGTHTGGNDLAVTNTNTRHDSGWLTRDDGATGTREYVIAFKGSNATVDIIVAYMEIHFRT